MLKVLCIGNSFSDDSALRLHEVLNDLGVSFKLGILYIGGCSLAMHLNNLETNAPAYEYRTNSGGEWETVFNHTIKDAVKSEDWDIITFQQASYDSGIPSSYDDLAKILPIVRSYNESAKFLWLMTWAYPNGSPHGGFSHYNHNQATMYESITDAVQTKILPNPKFSLVVPIGTAIQNARTSFFKDTLNRDDCHLSLDVGRYIAAVTFAMALGFDVDKLSFVPETAPEKTREVALESAKNAYKLPYQVTQSIYE